MSSSGICSAAQRVLRIWIALKGHSLTGLSNQEVAHIAGDSPANVTRAMATLMDEGLVMKLDNGRFAHSVRTLQIAQAHADHCVHLTEKMSQLNQRIAAGAR